MKKLLSVILAFSLSLAILPQGVNLVQAEETTPVLTEEKPTQLLFETDNLVIYQMLEADGYTYEYHEKIVTNGDNQNVEITKYKLVDDEKVLVDENEQTIETTENEDLLISDGQTIEPVLIEITDPNQDPVVPTIDVTKLPISIPESDISMRVLRYQTGSGGSYIADTRWITYSDGSATAIMNGNSPYYKYTTTGNSNFKIFKIYASDLRKKEWELTALGSALSVADDLIAAIRSGQVLTWTLLKTVTTRVFKTLPVLGTLYALWDYANTYLDARTYYRRI